LVGSYGTAAQRAPKPTRYAKGCPTFKPPSENPAIPRCGAVMSDPSSPPHRRSSRLGPAADHRQVPSRDGGTALILLCWPADVVVVAIMR
jgi:hypothetical protein